MKNGERDSRGSRLLLCAICIVAATLLLGLYAYSQADNRGPGDPQLQSGERGRGAQPAKGDPAGRSAYWFSRKGWQLGVLADAYRSALQQMQRMQTRSSADSAEQAATGAGATLGWTFIGPEPMLNVQPDFGGVVVGPPLANATGRLTALALDPHAAGRLFVGAAGGGMWRSTDAGNSFVAVSAGLPTLSIGAIGLNTATTPATIYIGTGEGNGSLDSYYGRGLFRSTNLGASWSQLAPGTFDGSSFTSLAIDSSKTPPVLFAGITDAGPSSRADAFFFTSNSAHNGLWRSTDGGASWSQYPASVFNGCTQRGGPCQADDVKIDPANPTNVYAAIDGQNVYRSTDEGNTWSAVSFPGVPATAMGRESLVVAPSSPKTVYAMLGAPDGVEYVGFFVSTDSGYTWASRSVPAASFTAGGNTVTIDGANPNNDSQSFYDQALAVSGHDPHTIYFGGIGLYRSTDSGASWTFLLSNGGAHSDLHAIAEDPFTSGLIYFATDGGLFSFGPSGNLTALNSDIAVGEIQGIGPHPTNSGEMLAGFQDAGTQLYSGAPGWNEVDAADGGFSLFDHTDPNFAYHTYASTQAAQIATSTDGGMSWDFLDPTENLTSVVSVAGDGPPAFYPPLAGDPSVAHRVFFGGHSVFVSTDGMFTWQQQTSQDLTGCVTDGCALEDVEFARSDHRVAYSVAMRSSSGCSGPCPLKVFTTSQADLNSGATWADVTGSLPFNASATQATGIALDLLHPNIAYLAISGFTSTTGVGHVFRTADSGSTWTQIDGHGGPSPLPDVPVLKLLVDATDSTGATLLAGTDIGVFRSTDTGATWAALNAGLPQAPVFDMAQNDNLSIFIGTHGRGAYLLAGEPTPTPTATPTPTPLPTPSGTPTPVPGHPFISGVAPSVIPVGASFTINGLNFTAGSVVNFFVATASGPLNAGPLTPSSRTLPTQLTVNVPDTVPIGEGFVTIEVINTDQSFVASNLFSTLLMGSAAAGFPSITSINGVGLAATSSNPSYATDNVETVAPQGSAVTIGGSGFDTANGVAVDVFCACTGGKVGPFFLNPGDAGLHAAQVIFTLPPKGAANSPATGPASFVVSNKGSSGSYSKKSNAVAAVIGAQIAVSSVTQAGSTLTVNGTGFSKLTVINFFNSQSGGVVNLGGLTGSGPAIPLTFIDETHFTFTVPSAAVPRPSYVQALNPPFVPFSSSGNGPGGAFALAATGP
jgi:photosystem II stability/assembly factor-like uncharacterized protein